MRSDIKGAIKNAMERGYSLEESAQSLINSGYPASEVNQTASEMGLQNPQPQVNISGQNSPQTQSQVTQDNAQQPSNQSAQPHPQPLPQQRTTSFGRATTPKEEKPKGKKANLFLIILLGIILLVLLTGFILTLVFRQEIISYLLEMFGN